MHFWEALSAAGGSQGTTLGITTTIRNIYKMVSYVFKTLSSFLKPSKSG